MSDEAEAREKEPKNASDQEAKPEGKAKGGQGMPILLVMALVGGVLGGAVGGMVLAPKMAGHGTAPAAASASASEGGKSSGKDKSGKGEATDLRIFRLDNVIVNPAGSEGTRFLMTSIAFEVPDENAENALKAHEVELRDLVIGKLESMTMPMLTEVHARDSLKAQLADAAESIVGPHAAVTVFLPQFVIQ